jgi:hypothetical protein
MKKNISIFVLMTASSVAIQAQSLSELERLQRRAQLVAPCEELVRAGVRDDACKDIPSQKFAVSQDMQHNTELPKVSANALIEITGYRSGEIGGADVREIEVVINGQLFHMNVGDKAMGWKLTQLTHFEAEFHLTSNRLRSPRIIGFRSPSAPPPAPTNTPGLNASSSGAFIPPPIPSLSNRSSMNSGPIGSSQNFGIPVSETSRIN